MSWRELQIADQLEKFQKSRVLTPALRAAIDALDDEQISEVKCWEIYYLNEWEGLCVRRELVRLTRRGPNEIGPSFWEKDLRGVFND